MREVHVVGFLAFGFPIMLIALMLILVYCYENKPRECTGYQSDPIYRRSTEGAMVREDRWRCVEWNR